MIRSFRDKATEKSWLTGSGQRFGTIAATALCILDMSNAAKTLADLRVPPANRLEALKGAGKGQYSIRINDQFRLCFKLTSEGPAEVEIVDDHCEAEG
jgi:proteic killer suppression protein